MRCSRKDALAVALLLCLSFLLYSPAFLHPDQLLTMLTTSTTLTTSTDTLLAEHFWVAFEKEALHAGELPLWNHYVFSGYPFATQTHKSFFYPPHALFFFLSFPIATAVIFFLHTFLAALFSYACARLMNLSVASALFTAAAFSFTGRFAAHLFAGHFAMVLTASWIPAAFFAIELLVRKRTVFNAVLFGVIMALQFLAGHAQIFLYTALALIPYFIWRFHALRLPTPFSRVSFLLLISALSFFGLTAIQLLPGLEHVVHSVRSHGIAEESRGMLSFSTPLWTLLFPGLHAFFTGSSGNFWEATFFIGFIPLFLAFPAVRHPPVMARFFIALAAFTFFFSLGTFNALVPLIPVLNLFHNYSRSMFLFAFAIAILAGFGYNLLSTQQSTRRLSLLLPIWLFLALLFAINLFIQKQYLHLLFLFLTASSLFIVEQHLSFSRTRLFRLVAFAFFLCTLLLFIARYALFLSIHQNLTILITITSLVAVSLLFILLQRHALSFPVFTLLLFSVLVLNLFSYSLPLLQTAPYQHLLDDSPLAAQLTMDETAFRIFDTASAIPQYLTPTYHLELITGYDPALLLQDYATLADAALSFRRPLPVLESLLVGLPTFPSPTLLSLLNVKYLTTSFLLNASTVDALHLTLVSTFPNVTAFVISLGAVTIPDVYLYELHDSLPRAYTTTDYRVVSNRSEILSRLNSNSFDPNQPLLEAPPSFSPYSGQLTPAAFTRFTSNHYTVHVNLSAPALLIISEPWYPGWQAMLNDTPLPVLRANYALKAVELPAGNHTLSFAFRPQTYRIGKTITLATLAAVALFFLFSFLKRVAQQGTDLRPEP